MWDSEWLPHGLVLNKTLMKIVADRFRVFAALDRLTTIELEFSPAWRSSALRLLEENFPDLYCFCSQRGEPFKRKRAARYERIGAHVALYCIASYEDHALRSWFIVNEIRLFWLYFFHLEKHKKVAFIIDNDIGTEIKDNVEANNEYSVSWKHVLPLVRKRAVLLNNGKAIILEKHIVFAASHFVENKISALFNIVRPTTSTIKLDPRLAILMDALNSQIRVYLEKFQRGRWSVNKSEASLQNLETLSYSFPPCMERMYQHFEKNHRLRYNGRQQLITFLKDIGFSLSEMLHYFQYHYGCVMKPEEYRSGKYPYFIEYLYGLHGRKMECFSFNCSQMKLNSKESTMDCHGCPLLARDSLSSLLSSDDYDHLSKSDKDSFLSLVDKTSPGELCGKILASKLRSHHRIVITNPLQYYSVHRKSVTVRYESDSE